MFGEGAGNDFADRGLEGSGKGGDLMKLGEGGGEVMVEFAFVGFFERVEAPAFGVFGTVLVGVLPVDEAT